MDYLGGSIDVGAHDHSVWIADMVLGDLDLEVAAEELAWLSAQAASERHRKIPLDCRMASGAAGHGDGLDAVKFVAQFLPLFPREEFGKRHRLPHSEVHGRQSSTVAHGGLPWLFLAVQPRPRRRAWIRRASFGLMRRSLAISRWTASAEYRCPFAWCAFARPSVRGGRGHPLFGEASGLLASIGSGFVETRLKVCADGGIPVDAADAFPFSDAVDLIGHGLAFSPIGQRERRGGRGLPGSG